MPDDVPEYGAPRLRVGRGTPWTVKENRLEIAIDVTKRNAVQHAIEHMKEIFQTIGVYDKMLPVKKLSGGKGTYRVRLIFILDVSPINMNRFKEIINCLMGESYIAIVSSRELQTIEDAEKILMGYRPVFNEQGHIIKMVRHGEKNCVVEAKPLSEVYKKIYGGATVRFYEKRYIIKANDSVLEELRKTATKIFGHNPIEFKKDPCMLGNIKVELPPHSSIAYLRQIKISYHSMSMKPPTPYVKPPVVKGTMEEVISKHGNLDKYTLVALSREFEKISNFMSVLVSKLSSSGSVIKSAYIEECHGEFEYHKEVVGFESETIADVKPYTETIITFHIPGEEYAKTKHVPKPEVQYRKIDLDAMLPEVSALFNAYPRLRKYALEGKYPDEVKEIDPEAYKLITTKIAETEYIRYVTLNKYYSKYGRVIIKTACDTKNLFNAKAIVYMDGERLTKNGTYVLGIPVRLALDYVSPGEHTFKIITNRYMVKVRENAEYYRGVVMVYASANGENILNSAKRAGKKNVIVLRGFGAPSGQGCTIVNKMNVSL